MLYKELIELFDILDSASASGSEVVEYLKAINTMCQAETYPLAGPNGHTDMVRIPIVPALPPFDFPFFPGIRIRTMSV